MASTDLYGWRGAGKAVAELEQEGPGVIPLQDATEDAVRQVSSVGSALAEPMTGSNPHSQHIAKLGPQPSPVPAAKISLEQGRAM